MKQEWSKTQARVKQDSSKIQARQQAREETLWKTITFFINLAHKEQGLKRILVWKCKTPKKVQKPLWFMRKKCETGSFSMVILVWKRKKEAEEPWGTFFRGGPEEPISRRKWEPLKTSFNRGTTMKQEWSKTQARVKQDSSKSQARFEQDSKLGKKNFEKPLRFSSIWLTKSKV